MDNLLNMLGQFWPGNWQSTYTQMYNKPTPTPSPTPTPTAGPVPTQAPFQFINGQTDYSYMKPKLEAMYQAKGNPPLAQYLDQFIQAGNKYQVDPRTLSFIGQIESSGGKNYPPESFNPFGYNASGGGMITGPDGKQYVNVKKGLINAGFTSIPQAIDLLTKRFSTQYKNGQSAYPNFAANPTLGNLQQSYNANSGEANGYMNLLNELSNLAR